MSRFLPVALLLGLVATAARAQQPDSLAAPTLPDSLVATRLRTAELFPFTTLLPALSRVAGVQATPYSGAPGAWAAVRIRGIAAVTGHSQPLYVVDGVPAYNTEVTPEEWAAAESFFALRRGCGSRDTPQPPSAAPCWTCRSRTWPGWWC